jgi:aryl-alcohol dehydrogenase-like predicted oxidoreductase
LNYRDLGETGMRVSEISLGTWAFGGEWGTVSEDDAYAALNRAIDLGVNFWTPPTSTATAAARSS